jgi:hypothetical protein
MMYCSKLYSDKGRFRSIDPPFSVFLSLPCSKIEKHWGYLFEVQDLNYLSKVIARNLHQM